MSYARDRLRPKRKEKWKQAEMIADIICQPNDILKTMDHPSEIGFTDTQREMMCYLPNMTA